MKQIRHSVFETNSSSTHSITIGIRKFIFNDFPRNSKEVFDIYPLENPSADGSENFTDVIVYRTEVNKTRFIVHMLVSHESENDFADMPQWKNRINGWWDVENLDEDDLNEFGNDLFALDPFKWLKEVIEKETGTQIAFHVSSDTCSFWDTVYDENKYIVEVLGLNSMKDEKELKKKIKEIIFNPKITIESKDESYHDVFDDDAYREL